MMKTIVKKIPHILKSNKLCRLPLYIICVDTETYPVKIDDETEKHILKLGYAIFWNREKNKKEYFYFEDALSFWDFVKSKLKKKKKVYIFAHNFDFDFQVLKGWDLLPKVIEGDFKKTIFDSSRFILEYRAKLPATISLISTTNYFKVRLEDVGKMLGLEKLKVDFEKVEKEELKEYCKRDTEILLKLIEYYLKFLAYHNLGNFKPTIASQSFTAFRHRFLKHKIYIHNNEEVIELERLSYYGGRNECFYIGKVEAEKIYKLDINSMYPYVMRNFYYPVKLVKHLKNISPKRLYEIMRNYLVIAKVKVKINTPCIPKKDKKLIFPIGVFNTVLASPELSLIKKYGEILEVKEVAIYQKAKIFKDFVDYFYNLRLKYKKEKNEIMQYFVKIFLNSLYGKFGEKKEAYKEVGFTETGHYEIIRLYDMDNKKWIYRKIINGRVFEKEGYEEGFNSFVAIASFTTSYARAYLWALMEKAGLENIYYCDTDSLFCNEEGYNNLKEYIDNKELGKLKLEEVGDYLEIRGCKDYTFNTVVKRKGIRKDAIEIGINKFKQIQFVKMRGNLLKYKEDGAIIKTVIKELRAEYDKGIIREDGRVIPLTLNEE